MRLSPRRVLHRFVRKSVSWMVLVTAPSVFAQMPFGPPLNLPPLTERRAAVLKEFDKDGDGRLSAPERDAAHQAWSKQMLSKREQSFFRPPPELIEEFDANKDGELDDEEGQKMRETLGRRFVKLTQDYDRNGNSRLDEDEIDAALKDIDAGKLKGIPKMFLQFARSGPRGRGPGPEAPKEKTAPGASIADLEPAEILKAADRDHDGRLSVDELQLARESLAKRREAKVKAADAK